MKVTLLIGNGFDIGLGLNTRYSDFYNSHYLKVQNENGRSIIRDMKEKIRVESDLWSDMEQGLKTEAMKIHNMGDDEDDFLDFRGDLVDELVSYLNKENERIRFQNNYEVMNDFVAGIKRIEEKINDEFPNLENINYDNSYTIIDFNFTSSVDVIMRTGPFKCQVCQPHGCLRDETSIVIGTSRLLRLNPRGQYEEIGLPEINKWLTKESVILSDLRLKNQYLMACDCIEMSDVICIYGMSIGESDELWWEKIIQWLVADEKHCVIIFAHKLNNRVPSRDPWRKAINRGDRIRDQLINFGIGDFALDEEREEDLLNRIRVLPDKGIFEMKIMGAAE